MRLPRRAESANRWVVIGDPGAGKSTLARHLTWKLAGDAQATPVYVSLPALCGEGCEHPFDAAENAVRSHEGKAAALGVAEALPGWVSSLPEVTVAVFSRIAGHDENPLGHPFERARLRELDPAKQRLLDDDQRGPALLQLRQGGGGISRPKHQVRGGVRVHTPPQPAAYSMQIDRGSGEEVLTGRQAGN